MLREARSLGVFVHVVGRTNAIRPTFLRQQKTPSRSSGLMKRNGEDRAANICLQGCSHPFLQLGSSSQVSPKQLVSITIPFAMATDSDQAKSDDDQAQAAHEAKATDSAQAKSDDDQAKAAHEAKATDSDQEKSDYDQDDQAKAALVSKAAMAAMASFAHQAKAAAAAAAFDHQAKAHLIMHLPDQQRSSQTQSCFSTERKHNLTKLTASTVPEQPRRAPYYTSSKAVSRATAKAADAFAAAARVAYCNVQSSRFNALPSPEPEDVD